MFVRKKFHIPVYQSYLSRTLNIERPSWTSIYSFKIKHIFEKKVAEFNFKLLNNLLCNKIFLRKIKKSESDLCPYCKAYSEDNEHLIFKCDNVNPIWKLVSRILKFEVQWKHILIGFYFEKNQKIVDLNNIISTLATIIYKYKMYCRLKDVEESKENISSHVKGSLKTYSCVYKRLKYNMCYNIFDKIGNILWYIHITKYYYIYMTCYQFAFCKRILWPGVCLMLNGFIILNKSFKEKKNLTPNIKKKKMKEKNTIGRSEKFYSNKLRNIT